MVRARHSFCAVAAILGEILLVGCAETGIVPAGQDTFRIYKRGATGFGGSDSIQAELELEASRYCADRGKAMQVVKVLTGQPPYIFNNYPWAEVYFKCVDANALESASGVKAEATPQLAPCEVSVTSNVPDAEVSVDGKFVGNAPLAALRLSAGTHKVEVVAKGYVIWKRELTVVQGSSTRVVAQLEEAPKP